MPTLPIRPTPSPKARTAAWANLLVKRIKAVEQQPSQPTTRHNALVNAGPSHAAVSMPRRHEAPRAPHGYGHRTSHSTSARRPAHRNTVPRSKPHRHGRREARLRGHRHQVRGLRHTQGRARPEALRAHRSGLPRRVRGGGPHQHPLRHREPPGDGFREGLPAPPQERPQRQEIGSKATPRGLRARGRANLQ